MDERQNYGAVNEKDCKTKENTGGWIVMEVCRTICFT
jgi:hypothetical protein